ncbi:large ribosomal subunit protein bL27 [Planococcus citri]|uniref:large ribosomal subunit protein bL27 n=1 Tax=Planococcus citri TaxID=170843 RepID=UPI0031F97CD3
MSFTSVLNSLKSFITPTSLQTLAVRHGHQMCTRNHAGRPKAKRRGIKRNHNANVLHGQLLVTQRLLKFHPGMNVTMDENLGLRAMVSGTVKVSCEKFDPDFDNPTVVRFYQDREGAIYKKYFNVVPYPLQGKFRLKTVV